MKSVFIVEKTPITNRVIELLLNQYNKKKSRRGLYLEETTYSKGRRYTFYHEVGDAPQHYFEGSTRTDSNTMLWLIHRLKEGV